MVDALTLQEILGVAGFLFGTVLHVILLGMIQRRRRRRPVERLFAFLVVACGLWNLGNFMAAFLHTLLPEQSLTTARMFADVVSVVGVAAIPSLSLHTLLSLLVQETQPAPFGKMSRAVLAAVMYTPLTFLPLVITRRVLDANVPLRDILSTPAWPFPGVLGAFLVWFILAFVLSAALAISLSRLRRHEAPRERTFYLSLSGILISTACLVLAIYLLGSQDIQAAGMSLEILVILASTVPSLLFAYYIHRYNDVEFLLRRSLFYLLLMVAIVLVYLWGISALSLQLEKTYGLRHQLVEAILILGLVFLFHPFRRGLQRLFTRIFFKESYTYRAVLNDLVSTMRRGPVRRLSTLLDQVAWRMRRTLSVESARIILMDESGRPNTASLPARQPPSVERLITWLGSSTAMPWVQVADLLEAGDDLCAAELAALDAEVVFAIRYERQLTGLFALGRKSDRSPFFAEELEVCSELADHLAVTVQTNRLYEEKLALERKILESEKLLSLGRFSASVAHRVKNPLSSIKAICQALGEDFDASDGRRDDLNIVVGEVDRLTEVINQLLHFAQPTKGMGARMKDSPPSCKVHDLLREVAILFKAEADIYDVNIQLPSFDATNAPPIVSGSRLDLREIFSNLIQNGIHAMSRGGTLSIEVMSPAEVEETPEEPLATAETDGNTLTATEGTAPQASAQAEETSTGPDSSPPIDDPSPEETDLPDSADLATDQDMIMVSVTDTGMGIRPENLAKVFEPFYTTKARGTGLGLAISRHKVDGLGGRLSVSSPAPRRLRVAGAEGSPAPGPGTTFLVYLPVLETSGSETQEPVDQEPADQASVAHQDPTRPPDSSISAMSKEPSIG